MIYLWKSNGGVLFFADADEAKRHCGLENPDMTVTDEEFEAAGGIARVIDGKIFLGLTKAEKLEQAQKEVREKRDRILSEKVDKMQGVLRWADLTDAQREAWTAYRKALLDIPQQKVFKTNPAAVVFPTKPE